MVNFAFLVSRNYHLTNVIMTFALDKEIRGRIKWRHR